MCLCKTIRLLGDSSGVVVPHSLKKDAYEVEIQNLLKWVKHSRDSETADDLCYWRKFRMTMNDNIIIMCVISGKQRCWTTLRTRVRTRSCRTLRGRPTSCSFRWRRRRTCPPGLSSPRYSVRARPPAESSHCHFCPSCILIVRKSMFYVFVLVFLCLSASMFGTWMFGGTTEACGGSSGRGITSWWSLCRFLRTRK